MLTEATLEGEPLVREDAGFAILETLVALAILAIALGVLLPVLTDGLRRQGRAEDVSAATLHAQSILARVGADVPLAIGVTTGMLPNGMYWLVRVEPFGDAADRKAWPASAYHVVVDVIPGDGQGNSPLARLTTLRLGPREPNR